MENFKNFTKKLDSKYLHDNVLTNRKILDCCAKAIRYSFFASLFYGVLYFFINYDNLGHLTGDDILDVVRDATYILLYLAAFRILFKNKENKIYSWTVYFLTTVALLYNYNYFIVYFIYALIGGPAEFFLVIRNMLFFYFFFWPFFVLKYLKKDRLLAWLVFIFLPLIWVIFNISCLFFIVILSLCGAIIALGYNKIFSERQKVK